MMRAPLYTFLVIALAAGSRASASDSPVLARNLPPPAQLPGQFESAIPILADRPPSQPATSRPAPAPTTELTDSWALLTGNNSASVRRLGARQLLALATPEAIDRLRGLLAQPTDPAAVTAICEVLVQTGAPPTPLLSPLVSLLADNRVGVSDAASRALAASQNGPVVTLVRTAALDAKNSMEHRLAAIRCLGRLTHDKSAVSALIDLVDDPSKSIQTAVLLALSDTAQERFGSAGDAKSWWSENRSASETQWQRRSIGALQRRYSAAVSTQGEVTQRLAALIRADFLRTPEADRPKALLTLLRDDLPAVRDLALDLVNTWITDRKEIGPDIRSRLGELIDDPDPALRRRAAKIVGELRLTAEASRLAAAIDREMDPEVLTALIDAAGRLDDRSFIKTLLPRLNDDSTTVVSATAGALANLTRRGFGRPEDVESVSTALANRLSETPMADELRARFLGAISIVASESLRTIVVAELDQGRPVATRCAALRALGAYRDARGAAEVRKWIDAEDPALRLAAVEALGGCGAGDPDLAALFHRVNPAHEQSAPVREQAWESYKLVAARCPAPLLLAAADQFAAIGSVADQERRIELLRIANQRANELGPAERVAIQERIGDARVAIGDFKAAAGAFEQAANGDDEAVLISRVRLTLKALDARLRGGEDDAAVEKIAFILNGGNGTGVEAGQNAGELVTAELARRLDASDSAGSMRLIDKCQPHVARMGDAVAATIAQLRTESAALQAGASDVEIDGLLADAATDPDAERQLMERRVRTLSRIHARLVRPPSTSPASRPADTEATLIALARRLAPDWRGFDQNASPTERGQALTQLAAEVRAATRANAIQASQPSSAPPVP